MNTSLPETPRTDYDTPGPEADVATDGLITVVQSYGAYFGYRNHVVEGAQPALDTLPKRTLADRTEYAILQPGQAVGVVETDEGGVAFKPGPRHRLNKFMLRLQPAKRSLVINAGGSVEASDVIKDTKKARKELEGHGIAIVPLTFTPTHRLGRPALRDDEKLFPNA